MRNFKVFTICGTAYTIPERKLSGRSAPAEELYKLYHKFRMFISFAITFISLLYKSDVKIVCIDCEKTVEFISIFFIFIHSAYNFIIYFCSHSINYAIENYKYQQGAGGAPGK
ncbi:MAG: hypothetical protein K0R21_2270 [Anaerocolumna sp.]|nr:hypothetical protein [Anaerocolumna sp.]